MLTLLMSLPSISTCLLKPAFVPFRETTLKAMLRMSQPCVQGIWVLPAQSALLSSGGGGGCWACWACTSQRTSLAIVVSTQMRCDDVGHDAVLVLHEAGTPVHREGLEERVKLAFPHEQWVQCKDGYPVQLCSDKCQFTA
eukprot:358126-Chlamydomonas_euryale.AAC.3